MMAQESAPPVFSRREKESDILKQIEESGPGACGREDDRKIQFSPHLPDDN
jgi:hypothetical protein